MAFRDLANQGQFDYINHDHIKRQILILMAYDRSYSRKRGVDLICE